MIRDVSRTLVTSVLAVALVGTAACGDYATSEPVSEDEPRGEGPNETNFVLIPGVPEELDVGAGESVDIEVMVYEQNSGEPVADKTVQFAIPDGTSHGSLSAKSAVTDRQGRAGITFRAGQSPGSATVRATQGDLEPLDFEIEVTQEPSGALEVLPRHTAPSLMSLSDVEVRVYETDSLNCGDFRALATDRKEPFRHDARDAPGKKVLFEMMGVDKEYTITATARGEYDQIAAGGCADGIQLTAGETRERELLLQLIPLEPAGQYRAISHWDFSEAVKDQGVVGEAIGRFLAVFENPGDAIYNELMNLIESFVGGLAGKSIDWLADQLGLDDEFKELINETVQNNEALCKVREAGRDLGDVVKRLEVESIMTIGRLQSDYEFQGRDTWQAVTVYWRGKCDDAYEEACSGSQDDSDPSDRRKDCAEIRIEADEDDKLEEFGVLTTQWTGRVSSYDQLRIHQHDVPLEYGKFLDWLLAEHILPGLTDGNASSLADAFAYWVGCDSLADSVTGSNDKICAPQPIDECITASDLEGLCNSAVTTVFGAADLLLRELKFDTGITVGGEGLLIETTSDAKVDRIEEGIYEGYIEVNGNQSSNQGRSSIDATWSAERIESE